MIEQTTLMNLAKDFVATKVTARSSLRAALLTGSVARGEPPLGDAVDIDIILIDDDRPALDTELVRLSDDVFIDAAYVAPAAYADRKAVRAHHFMGPALNDAVPLHDPQHFFDLLQASIRAPYNRPDQIYARARSAYAVALTSFDSIAPLREAPPPEPLPLEAVFALHQTLYLAAVAVLLLSGQPGDATGPRKLMVRFEAAVRQLQPDLYPLFLAALGAADVPPAAVETLLDEWLAAYQEASRRKIAEPLVHPFRRSYYARGFRALIAEGHELNTLWLMEHTFAACVGDRHPQPEGWLNCRRTMGKSSGAAFAERARWAGAVLALTDQTLIQWAKGENVEL